jgi:hypothetical protein
MFDTFKSTYFANATAARDYRVQLRGNRSILLFGLYLLTLIGVAFVVYETQASGRATSVVQAQEMLNSFYTTIMALLGGMIALIAPALSATTIVQERMRRSFDLVFSAPVTPRYYLVGKTIASYRYVWMLLALSLPVTAASVVLGGASWSDVLVGYILLSMQALVFTSIALLMSTLAPKPVSAVMWTYAAIVMYLMFCTSIGAITLFGGFRSREQLFTIAMNPFTTTVAADTYTMILGREVPNWILASVASLLIVRLILLTAGSLLSPYGGKEGRALRINGLVYTFGIAMLVGYLNGGSAGWMPADAAVKLGRILCWSLMPLAILVPFMTCYGYDGERLHWPNGMFNPRRLLDGTPAGALPFLLAVVVTFAIGLVAGCGLTGLAGLSVVRPEFLVYLLFAIGFWTMMWGFGRFASLSGSTRNGRTLQFALFLLVTILPLPFLSAVAYDFFETKTGLNVWYAWVLYPLTRDFSYWLVAYGVAMLGVGWFLALKSDLMFAHRIRVDLVEDERLYARA